MPTIELGKQLDADTAKKALAIYREAYPECRLAEDDDGNIVHTYPECPMVLRKDKPGALDAYFTAGDLNVYRAALRAIRKPPIACVPVAPEGTERPITGADQEFITGLI